jgi:hypothetical protein
MRYNELKVDSKVHTEQWKIDEILIEKGFNWLVNAEIENARLEILKDILIWNAGIWYNGTWEFGVFRDGEWKYGTWKGGVWYNGKWKDGTFKEGIIYKGIFVKGNIQGGEIRGGKFIDCEISSRVKEYVEGEKEQEQQELEAPVIEPVKVQKLHVVVKENNSIKMKNIKNYKGFVKESTGDIEPQFVGNGFDNVDVKQIAGGIEMSSNSKTDIYNLKQTHGGEVIEKDGMYILYITDGELKLHEEHNEGKSANFKIGDEIIYSFQGKEYTGKIVDHFGEGVMVVLDKYLHYPNPTPGANPMGYNTDVSTISFELYDGENNPWGSIEMLKLNRKKYRFKF